MGRRAEARQILARLEPGSRELPLVAAAGTYAARGETDEAFKYLFRLVDEHSANDMAILIKQDPPFDTLRSDPRWTTLLSRLNFPPDTEPIQSR